MELQLLVLSLHQKYTYRSRSRFTVVVDVRLSDDDWSKLSREAEKLAVDLYYDCLSYVQFSILFSFYYDSQSIPSIQGLNFNIKLYIEPRSILVREDS